MGHRPKRRGEERDSARGRVRGSLLRFSDKRKSHQLNLSELRTGGAGEKKDRKEKRKEKRKRKKGPPNMLFSVGPLYFPI